MSSAAAWFGPAFAELHPLLQALHTHGGTLQGEINIEFGSGLAGFLGRRAAQRMGIPNTNHAQFRVHISHQADGMHWDREFDQGSTFRSLFKPIGTYPDGYWEESSGMLNLKLQVAIRNGGWHWVPLQFRLFGIPIPAWLRPRTIAFKEIRDGRYHFHVEVIAPLLGMLICYSGNLQALHNKN